MKDDFKGVARKRCDAVRRVLGPNCDKAKVEAAVRTVLVAEQRSRASVSFARRPENAKQKEAVEKLSTAVNRLALAVNNPNLPKGVARRFPSYDNLKKLVAELDDITAVKLTPKRSANMKDVAAAQAALLLHEHNIELKTTRGGKFHRVAGALHGDGDLFDKIRKYRDVAFAVD